MQWGECCWNQKNADIQVKAQRFTVLIALNLPSEPFLSQSWEALF